MWSKGHSYIDDDCLFSAGMETEIDSEFGTRNAAARYLLRGRVELGTGHPYTRDYATFSHVRNTRTPDHEEHPYTTGELFCCSAQR